MPKGPEVFGEVPKFFWRGGVGQLFWPLGGSQNVSLWGEDGGGIKKIDAEGGKILLGGPWGWMGGYL